MSVIKNKEKVRQVEIAAEIIKVGGKGDGVARAEGGKEYFVPFTLAGEEVRIAPLKTKGADDARAELKAIVTPSPLRAKPVCPYFTKCGGCALQHMEKSAYLDFKLGALRETLAHKGVELSFSLTGADIVQAPIASRRRAEFHFVKAGDSSWFGFKAMKSNEIVAIKSCAVLAPALASLIPVLRGACKELCAERVASADIFVTLADNGADILITARDYPPLSFLENLPMWARAAGVVRAAWRSEPDDEPQVLLELAKPVVEMGGRQVALPFGSFLQASAEAEKALAGLVIEMAGEFETAVDLFCGLGSFTLPLLRAHEGAKVVGYDSFAPAVEEMAKYTRAEVRDLFTLPLPADELAGFEVAVLDPPRAGAAAQVAEIVASKVRRVVYISCNPASFARDAKALIQDGGFRLVRLVPVDQFVFSPHLEIVAEFER